jgi:HK97 family phage major capsid protein
LILVGAVGTMPAMKTHTTTDTILDLPKRVLDRYSIGELIRAAAHEDTNTLAFYSEISDSVAAKTGQQPSATRSFFVPGDYMRRDLTVATPSAGGYLVDAPVLDFAGALHAASLTSRLPLRRIPAKGNASVAVMVDAPTTTWLSSESAEIADAAPTFGTRSATPKTVSTVAWLSRQLVLQAPASPGFAEQQMAAEMAKAIDTAFVSGSGASGQPTGLLTLSNTTNQSGTSLAYTGVTAMVKAAEGYSANQPHVLMGVDTAALMRQRAKVTGSGPILDGGSVDGLPTIVSRAVPANAMLVFDPTLIAEVRWGALEIAVTPFASPDAFKRGAIGVRLIQSLDWIVDHPVAVAKSTSIT